MVEEQQLDQAMLGQPDQVLTVHGRLGNVTFRPYRDIKTRQVQRTSEERDNTSTTVDNLYPEILCQIFSYLDTASKGRSARVCSRWRTVLNTKEIWRGCQARLHLRRLSSSVIPNLVRRGIKDVQVLSIRKSLKDLLSGLQSLASLNLSGLAGLSDSTLQTMLGHHPALPGLTSLDLSLCKEVTDASIEVITNQATNLETLRLGGCTGISNLSLRLVASSLPRLTVLDLRSCWQVADSGILQLSSSSSSSAQPAPLQLELLNLQDCQKVSDLALRHLSTSPGLLIASLNLSFCANISDSGMKSLAKMSCLRSLNLRSCDNISDIGLGYLAEGSVGLQTLDVSFCDRVTDRSVSHGLTTIYIILYIVIFCRKIRIYFVTF